VESQPAGRPLTDITAEASGSCAAPSDESKGLIVYVNTDDEARAALSTFDQLDNPPDCCRMRTRRLVAAQPGDHPDLIGKVEAHLGSWPLPLTVVDGHPVVAERLPTFAELQRFTNGKTYGPAPSLLPS